MSKYLSTLSWYIYKRAVNSKRRLFNWRGDGVHSPYAFNFIRQILCNPHPFDAFARLYDKQKAKRYRKHFAGDSITQRSSLEIIFRAVHAHKPQSVCCIGRTLEDDNTPSLLIEYIQATGYNNLEPTPNNRDIVILEYLPQQDISLALKGRNKNCMLIINLNSPELRVWIKQARKELRPPIVFKLVEFEIWVWRDNTTPGVYPVYYR